MLLPACLRTQPPTRWECVSGSHGVTRGDTQPWMMQHFLSGLAPVIGRRAIAALWGRERGRPLPCKCILIKSRASGAFSKSSASCSVSVDALPPAPWQGLCYRVLWPRSWADWTQRGGVWGERCDPAAWKVFFSHRNGLLSDIYCLKPVNIGLVLTAGSPWTFFVVVVCSG